MKKPQQVSKKKKKFPKKKFPKAQPIKKARMTFSRELSARSTYKTVLTDLNVAQLNKGLYVWDYCYPSSEVQPGDRRTGKPFSPLMLMTFNYTTMQINGLTNNFQVIIQYIRSNLESAMFSHPNYNLLSRQFRTHN